MTQPTSFGPLLEAVFSVGKLDEAVAFFHSVTDWETVHSGSVNADVGASTQLDFWSLPPRVGLSEVLLRDPKLNYGGLRLVHFHNVEQRYIRTGAALWHTGGIYNINLRVRNIERVFNQMRERGWRAHSEPHEYNFSGLVVREVMVHGPDDVCIALVERVAPPLEGWHFDATSHVYNSTQIVRDYAATRDFYVNGLGFDVRFETPLRWDESGPNVYGVPHNLAPGVTGILAIFQPPNAEQSTVEVIQLEGATGHDYSANAVPPNRGVLMLRLRCADVRAYHEQLTTRGVPIHAAPRVVNIAPYGDTLTMAVRTPDGAWLEFVQE